MSSELARKLALDNLCENTDYLLDILWYCADWMEGGTKEILQELLDALPQDLRVAYTETFTHLYRGIAVLEDDEIYNEPCCSWSTDIYVTSTFMDEDRLTSEVSLDSGDIYYRQQYHKNGTGFNLCQFCKDIICRYAMVLEVSLIDPLLNDDNFGRLRACLNSIRCYVDEYEVISDFNIAEVELLVEYKEVY